MIDLTDENMPPPPPPPAATQQQQEQTPSRTSKSTTLKRASPQLHQRKLPMQVGGKKMLLPYDNPTKPPTFFGYKMFYLSRAQQLIFKSKVKLFQCNSFSSDVRLGVALISEDDKMSLVKMLNNVAGSLPVTAKVVKRPMEDTDDVLFVTMKKQRATVFDHRGRVLTNDKLPKVCTAKLLLTINGMKLKDDEASFIITVGQIMVCRHQLDAHQPQHTPKMVFPLSSSDDDDDEDESMMVE